MRLFTFFEFQYQTLKPQYEKEIKAALIGDGRVHTNEEPRPSDNTKQSHSGRRGQNVSSPNSKAVSI